MTFKCLNLKDSGIVLPSHVPSLANVATDITANFKSHFIRCLHVHMGGGNIEEQYSFQQVRALIEGLGVGVSDDVDVAPLDDPRWQTEIGKEVFEAYMSVVQ